MLLLNGSLASYPGLNPIKDFLSGAGAGAEAGASIDFGVDVDVDVDAGVGVGICACVCVDAILPFILAINCRCCAICCL